MNSTTIAVDVAKAVFEVAVSEHPGQVRERHRFFAGMVTTSDASMRERYAGDIRDHDSRSRAWSTALLLVVIAGRLFRGAGGRSYLVCPRGDRQSSGQTSTTEAAGEKLPPPGLTSTVGRRHGTLGLGAGDPRWGIP
jgi:hypothetical protein